MEYLLEFNFFKRKYNDIPINFLFYRYDNIFEIDSIHSIFTICLKIEFNKYLVIGRLICNSDLTYASSFYIDFFQNIFTNSNFLSQVNQVQYDVIIRKLRESKTVYKYLQYKFINKNFINNEIERMKKIKDKYKDIDPYDEENWEE